MSEVTSKALWQGLVEYHNMGLSMIWARRVDESKGGTTYRQKTPIGKWKGAQTQRYTLEHLAKVMEQQTVELSPVIITGKVSNNLESIDIDVKNGPGIDVAFFTAVKDLYPEIHKRLRIHRTPSTGAHVPYFCEEEIGEGNQKLAVLEGYKEAAIETRGEGGYILCPPGRGYTVVQDNPIPTLTRSERDALINLAKTFDTRVSVKKERSYKSDQGIYDENPFEHFNASSAARDVLIDNGWKFFKESDQFIQYTRPGKATGESASFIKDKNLYHIFTSSTQLEPETNYTPSRIKAILEFQEDYKELRRWLVQNGYGKINKDYERRILPKKVIQGGELPPNFSKEAKELYEEMQREHAEKYPLGIFWEPLKEGEGFKINRPDLHLILKQMGYRLYEGEPVKIEKPFIRKVDNTKNIHHELIDYIKEDDPNTKKEILQILDVLWERSASYFIESLAIVPDEDILQSSFLQCYKFFRNGVLRIERDKMKFADYYTVVDGLVPEWCVLDGDYDEGVDYEGCMYLDFLEKAITSTRNDLMLMLGFLGYDHNDSIQGYIISLQEESQSSRGGGSGKGVFCQLLDNWVRVLTVDADRKVLKKEELLQSWTGEEVVHMNDVPRRFNLSLLKGISTDGMQRKRLWKNLENIPPEKMPKFVMSGQWGQNVFDDGGVKRRMYLVSFTSYFNHKRRVMDEYGGMLPNVWSKSDWGGFYKFMALSVQKFMQEYRLDSEGTWQTKVWSKNFDQTFGRGSSELQDWIGERLVVWSNAGFVSNETLKDEYHRFCERENIKMENQLSTFKKALQEYCEHHGYGFEEKRGYDSIELKTVRGVEIKKVEVEINPDDDLEGNIGGLFGGLSGDMREEIGDIDWSEEVPF